MIIEQSDVTQHMHVHLFSHWDHSVFIHHVLVNFFWWTGQSFYMIIKPFCVPMDGSYKTNHHHLELFLNQASTHPLDGIEL